MKVKLTDKANDLPVHEFALNYGINFKQLAGQLNKAVPAEFIEIDDQAVVDALKADGMIEESSGSKPSKPKEVDHE